MHNLTPPPLAATKSGAFPGGSPTHRRTTSRLSKGDEGNRGDPTPVLPSLPLSLPSFFLPSLPPESRCCPAPGVLNQGCRRAGRRRAPGPRAYNCTHAPRTRRAPAPARRPRRLRAARRSPVAWASAPGSQEERSGAQPPATRPARQVPAEIKGKNPNAQRPTIAPQESTGSGREAWGQRTPGSGPKLTRSCERRCRRWRTRRCLRRRRRCRAGPAPAGRSCEGAEMGSAPASAPRRPGLGSPRCAGAARSLRRPVAALRLPPGRSLSRAPAAARFFNVHRQ